MGDLEVAFGIVIIIILVVHLIVTWCIASSVKPMAALATVSPFASPYGGNGLNFESIDTATNRGANSASRPGVYSKPHHKSGFVSAGEVPQFWQQPYDPSLMDQVAQVDAEPDSGAAGVEGFKAGKEKSPFVTSNAGNIDFLGALQGRTNGVY